MHVLQYFQWSAKEQKIIPAYFAIPNYIYDGWFQIKIVHMLEALKSLKSKHVLYTDGNDSIFLADAEEIWRKYEDLGAPKMLVSASVNALNDTWMGNEYYNEAITHYPDTGTPYKYPHAGSYIGERTYIMSVFERMLPYGEKWSGDDAQAWHESWANGWFRPQLDLECNIFQVGCDGHALKHLKVINNRYYNTETSSYPCILHDNGGYTDPVEGKLERMKKHYEAIYDHRTV
jgi:hypothetical protein